MKIVCFGSMNIDYVYTVDHILAPGETLEGTSISLCAGGKGLNQAIALGRAGANCYMAGNVGQDGTTLMDELNSSNVNTSLIRTTQSSSGHTIIQVDKKGQNCILYFGGANKTVDREYIEEVLSICECGDYVLLQNEINMVPEIMKSAKQKGMKIAFNPSPISEEINSYPLKLVDILILNENEGQSISGKETADDILKSLHSMYPETDILLTLGKKGAIFKNSETEATHGIYDVRVIDTTGAGDTFTGFFLEAYTSGKPIDECLKYASIASSIAVTRRGAAQSIPTIDEVINSNLKLQI